MNSFFEHHKDSIRWHYRCFDRILLNGLIQPFQQPERVVGFFNTYRQLYPVTRYTLRDIADQFQRWVKERAAKRNIPIIEAPTGRRDEFVGPYFHRAMYGRRPRCKRNLTFSEAFGCGHVFGLYVRPFGRWP